MKITPYLIFNGEAEEAANFYAGWLRGTIENLYRYDSVPPNTGLPPVTEENRNKILHGCIAFDGGTISMADTVTGDRLDFGNGGHVLTLSCDSMAQIEERYTEICAEARKIPFALAETYFAKWYAEVVDRFGITWALMYEEA